MSALIRLGWIQLLLWIGLGFQTSLPANAARAGLAGLASVVPGLGQAFNGNPWEGLTWFGTTVGLFFSGNGYAQQVGYDLWQYNMYDAYRDAQPANDRYKDHNVLQNYIATFNPYHLIDPIGAPIVAYGAIAGYRNQFEGVRRPLWIPYYAFVGLGEEALFRGFLFPALSHGLGTVFGAVTSSAAFSLFHFTNGAGALQPFPLLVRFVAGLLFCWQVHRNEYDLRNNIFAHSWYDIFVAPGSPSGVVAPAPGGSLEAKSSPPSLGQFEFHWGVKFYF